MDDANHAVGEAIGKRYVEKHFDARTKERADEMAKNIIAAFAKRIDALSWMSPQTKAHAKAKVAGLTVGLFQALTSIQELTLTFVPKLAAIIGVFWLSMGFMTQTLVSFFQDHLIPVITGG